MLVNTWHYRVRFKYLHLYAVSLTFCLRWLGNRESRGVQLNRIVG
jgi:hypothetical protein